MRCHRCYSKISTDSAQKHRERPRKVTKLPIAPRAPNALRSAKTDQFFGINRPLQTGYRRNGVHELVLGSHTQNEDLGLAQIPVDTEFYQRGVIPSCPVRRTSHGQNTGKGGTREGQGRDKEPDRNLTPYGHPTDKEPDTTDKEPDTTDILRTHADMKEDTCPRALLGPSWVENGAAGEGASEAE